MLQIDMVHDCESVKGENFFENAELFHKLLTCDAALLHSLCQPAHSRACRRVHASTLSSSPTASMSSESSKIAMQNWQPPIMGKPSNSP